MASEGKILAYDSLKAKLGLGLCNLTLPFWGAIAPCAVWFCLLFMVLAPTLGLASADGINGFKILGMALPFIISFVSGLILTGIMNDNHLVVSQQGLALPIFKSITNKFDTFIEWQNIEKVVVSDGDLQKLNKIKLTILTKDGGTVSLNLKNMALSDIEFILVSMSNWAPANALDSRLGELKEILWNQNSENLGQEIAASYTKLWEDELAGRFSATAYIPLNPNQMLQDSSLKVVRQLAFGGWSAVYLVRDINTKLRVLKESVIPPGVSSELKIKASVMFEREAQLLLKLDHPNIVKVHKHFNEDDRHYLLLDYIGGQSMRQLVNLNGPFHPLDVIEHAQAICHILAYLHSQQPPVLHRDLTPDNLMLDNDGRLILIDFGAANELLGTATGTLVGKQSYISPEQFAGHATAGSDLYSLGATLYFMVTGVDPEPLSQSSATLRRNNIPVALNQLIERLTAQDQKERPPISEIQQILNPALQLTTVAPD